MDVDDERGGGDDLDSVGVGVVADEWGDGGADGRRCGWLAEVCLDRLGGEDGDGRDVRDGKVWDEGEHGRYG